jgi:hypothetical protein
MSFLQSATTHPNLPLRSKPFTQSLPQAPFAVGAERSFLKKIASVKLGTEENVSWSQRSSIRKT